jgi:hypothetical protein
MYGWFGGRMGGLVVAEFNLHNKQSIFFADLLPYQPELVRSKTSPKRNVIL